MEKEAVSRARNANELAIAARTTRGGDCYGGAVTKAVRKSTRSRTSTSPRSILVPIDFSVASKNALRHALDLSGNASRIILLHVIAPSAEAHRDVSGLVDSARKSLYLFGKSEVLLRDRSVRSLVRTGTPFHEILAAAKENKVELIVLAVHDLAPLGGLALGHTVDRVSRYAPCPVMLVREDGADRVRMKTSTKAVFPSHA